MDSNFSIYNHVSSAARIDSILAQPQGNYEEVDALPDRDKLTYSNGFYAYCSALFVDIRDSSKLPQTYKRPKLAKLYRSFISEMVAVMNGISTVREVNIVGDCVWAVYNTPQRDNIDEVFAVAAQGHSLVKILNYKLEKAGYSQLLRCGFGMEYGRALMVKAGYSGSGIADVIYMGDVVNQSAKLASQGSKGFAPPIMVGNTFASNLNEENTRLIQKDWSRDCYTGNVINLVMEDWYQENCK